MSHPRLTTALAGLAASTALLGAALFPTPAMAAPTATPSATPTTATTGRAAASALTGTVTPAAGTAAAPSANTAAAAAYLVNQFGANPYLVSSYTGAPDVALTADGLLGLVATGGDAAKIQAAYVWLGSQTTSLKPGSAARIAIVVEAMGGNPASVNGTNLLSQIADDTACNVGYGGYTCALETIALVRAGQPVPAAIVDGLEKGIDADMTGYASSYGKDYDSAAMVLLALSTLKADATAAADAALVQDWLLRNLTAGNHWESSSPVNTTGLAGSTLNHVGVPMGSAVTWMLAQQGADGGLQLPSPTGPASDAYATAQGVLLLSGQALLTVKFVPAAAPAPTTPAPSPASAVPSAPTPAATASASAPTTTNPGLANTGGAA